MPRYVIHVGPMKTGSTYLQQCLTSAAADLRAQGVCYPLELLDKNNKHMHLPVFSAIRRNTQAELKPIFDRLNASDFKTIILSCEFLSKLGRKPLSSLKALVGVADIQIVYAVRRWGDRIPSMWFQSLFAGGAHSLPEYYVTLLNGMAKNAEIDYLLCWKKLADIFGRDHLTLFPYSSIMDRGEDIFARFCTDVLDLQTVPKPEKFGTKLWASFSMEDTEILRVLNALNIGAHGSGDARMYWQMKQGRDALDTALITDAMHKHLSTISLDETARHFDRTFRRMEDFADRVVGGGALFERKPIRETYVAPEYLLRPGVAGKIQTIFDKFSTTATSIPAEEDGENYGESL